MDRISTSHKHVALVELGGSHAETLHSQIHWLDRAGHKVHLICNPGLQNHVIEKSRLAGQLLVETRPKQKSPFLAYSQFRRIRRYCRTHKIQRLILNTAEINEVRYLVFFSRIAGVRCDGILHNGKKLNSSWLLRGLSRFNMQRIMVMHDFVRSRVARVSGVSLESFYPIYFPSSSFETSESTDIVADQSSHKERRFRVAIVGTMLRTRKDSMALADALQTTDLASNAEIEILGHFDRDVDRELYDRLSKAKGFGEQFRFSPGFKDANIAHRCLSHADLILPLLYPRGEDSFYGEHRVSGAMNAAFGYKVPMLLHDSWKGIPDYDASSFYHASSQLVHRINELAKDRTAIEQKKRFMNECPNFSEAVQGTRYLKFLGLYDAASNQWESVRKGQGAIL